MKTSVQVMKTELKGNKTQLLVNNLIYFKMLNRKEMIGDSCALFIYFFDIETKMHSRKHKAEL